MDRRGVSPTCLVASTAVNWREGLALYCQVEHESCSLASVFAVLILAKALVAEDKVPRPGPVPDFYVVTAVNKDGLVIEHLPRPTKEIYNKEEYKPTFKGLDAVNGKGRKLSAEEVSKRLVNVDDQPLAAAFLALLNEDTVILSGVLPHKGATAATVE